MEVRQKCQPESTKLLEDVPPLVRRACTHIKSMPLKHLTFTPDLADYKV